MRPSPRSAVALLALLVAGLLTGLVAGPASAHDVLIGTDPADGAVLSTPPAHVRLTFAQQALSIGTRMRITGPDGVVVSSQPVQVVGSYVTQPLDAGLKAGHYTVLWRVTSADGHPVSGSLSFTLSGTSSAAPASPQTASPQASSTAGSSSSAGSLSTATAALLAVAVLGVLIGIPAAILRRRHPRSGP